jgi:hypothetical protein
MTSKPVNARAVRLLSAVAALGLSALLATRSPQARGPYLSALGDLALGRPAEAAPAKCSNRTCSTLSSCVHANGSNTNCGVGDFCRTLAC